MAGAVIPVPDLVAALAKHFGHAIGAEQSTDRDIAIWICRHWTTASSRAIADQFQIDQSNILRAEERIADARKDDEVLRQRVKGAEDYLAAEAFPLEDEDAEDEEAMAAWSDAQRARDTSEEELDAEVRRQ